MDHSDSRPRLSDLAQEEILYRIRSGELPVGSRLPSEPELAQQMGISRGILREALNALQTRGYITRTQRGGSHIAQPEVTALSESLMKGMMNATLAELIDYREALETHAALNLLEVASDEDIAHLRDLAQSDSEHDVMGSRDFHYHLAELALQPLFAQFIDFYFERVQMLTKDQLLNYIPKFLTQDLNRILLALENRNERTLRTAMKRHFRHVRIYYRVF